MKGHWVLSVLMALSGAIYFSVSAGHRDIQGGTGLDDAHIFEIHIPDNDTVGQRNFAIRITVNRFCKLRMHVDNELPFNTGRHATLTNGPDTVRLCPSLSSDRRECRLLPERTIAEGEWTLDIPEGLLYADMDPETVAEIPVPRDSMIDMGVAGAWNKPGDKWEGPAVFTIHDDDTIDGAIPSSNPAGWMCGGYFSTLFPVLESLGLRGCLSMEGWRCGFMSDPPALNENGLAARRLQDERGWEIQSHSMTARYGDNNWLVHGLDSELADTILSHAVYAGERSNQTTSVYDTRTRRQYSVTADSAGWKKTALPWIKPYVNDWESGSTVAYSPVFPVDYQWGEWFRTAARLGIRAKAWVTPGPTSSHANVPLINDICPYGFESDGQTFYNLPPMHSTATRLMMEGQSAGGYTDEQDPDNTFNSAHYNFFRRQIDEASSRGGWIILGLHAYRPCWVNRLPGALVSEGGGYPDAWVDPMAGVDPVSDGLTPPPGLGITEWSQWYPCPGTRLYMLWELLKYARDKGMACITSSEGFRRFGNTFATGYYNAGIKTGPDTGQGILGTRPRYPHYVIGADGAETYYKPAANGGVTRKIHVVDISGQRIPASHDRNHNYPMRAISTDGLEILTDRYSGLPRGIWIVNGRKIIIK